MSPNISSPPIRAEFAKRLKALRIPRGFPTARSFATALDIDENRYTRYERAEVEPDLSLIARICDLLSVSPNDLLGFASPPVASPGGFAEPPAPEVAGATDAPAIGGGSPRRALAWQLAEELGKLDGNSSGHAFDRFSRVSRMFAEIDADTFTFMKHLATDARFGNLDSAATARIGEIAAALMTAINAEILGPSAPHRP